MATAKAVVISIISICVTLVILCICMMETSIHNHFNAYTNGYHEEYRTSYNNVSYSKVWVKNSDDDTNKILQIPKR
jgi:hypothetical protein